MRGNIRTKNTWWRVSSRVATLALGASVVLVIGIPVAGVFTGGTIRADFAVALIVVSVIIDIAALSSYTAGARVQRIVHLAWVTIAIICLAFSQYILRLDYSDSPRAADSVLVIVMYLLAFPVGNIAAGLLIVLDQVTPSHANSDWLDLVIYWAVFFTTGYLQWFKLFPWVVEKWRARRLKKLDENERVV